MAEKRSQVIMANNKEESLEKDLSEELEKLKADGKYTDTDIKQGLADFSENLENVFNGRELKQNFGERNVGAEQVREKLQAHLTSFMQRQSTSQEKRLADYKSAGHDLAKDLEAFNKVQKQDGLTVLTVKFFGTEIQMNPLSMLSAAARLNEPDGDVAYSPAAQNNTRPSN